MKLTFSVCIFLTFSFQIAFAQEIEVLWDSIYKQSSSELLRELILLDDGRLAGVAEMCPKKKEKDALFFFIDTKTGEMNRFPFPGFRNQVFKDVAEADFGGFYLVGYKNVEGENEQQGWLVRLDENGNILQNETYGGIGGDEFQEIIWLNRGPGVIIGQKSNIPEGYLWLKTINKDKIEDKNAFGDGFISDLAGMEKDEQNRIWICSNTKKRDDIWLIETKSHFLLPKPVSIGQKSDDEVHAIWVTEEGEVLAAGKTYKAINGESDSWLATYDPTFEEALFKDFNYPSDDKATAIYQAPNGKKWMAQRSKSKNSSIIAWEKDDLEEVVMEFNRATDFECIRIFKTQQGTYIAAGTSNVPSGKRRAVRIIHFKNGDLLASKGLGKLEVSKNPSFEDSDGDEHLSPGEWATVYFSLKNLGDAPVETGKITVKIKPADGGLTITRGDNQFIPYMAAGKEREFKIGLRGEENLSPGEIEFEIKVEPKGQIPFFLGFKLECRDPVELVPKSAIASDETTFILQQPRLGDGRRKLSVTDNRQAIKLTLVSKKMLKSEDVKLVINNTVQKQQKADEMTWDFLEEQQSGFAFEYSTVLNMTDSINVVYVMVDDYKMDSIVFELKSNAPNLHILSVGPTYPNLKYTVRDARAFAQAFAKQADKGFFDEIYVDTILTGLSTTHGSIKSKFKSLLARWDTLQNQNMTDKILPNDYLVIFYSGHGIRKDTTFYLMPSDYLVNQDDDLLLDYEYLLTEYLNKIKCKKILFMDACHSGTAKNNMVNTTLAKAIVDANNSAPGLMSFLSCSANEFSYEDREWRGGHGAFTTAILEAIEDDKLGLTSERDENYIPVSARILADYLKKRVPELVQSQGASQNPILTTNELPYYLTIFVKENENR